MGYLAKKEFDKEMLEDDDDQHLSSQNIKSDRGDPDHILVEIDINDD